MILGERCVLSLIYCFVAVCRLCAVGCLIIICFSLLFSNYSTYFFFNIPFTSVSLFCIFVLYFMYSVGPVAQSV